MHYHPLRALIPVLLGCSVLSVSGQGGVGINNPSPHASALLDLTSTNKGLLMPRMTTAQRTAIASPATGLLVFDVSLNAFYFFDGTIWQPMASGSAGWSTTGNAGTTIAMHFLGTTDDVPLSFRVNSIAAGRIDHLKANVTLGLRAGAAITTATSNVLIGDSAATALDVGMENTVVGDNAARSMQSFSSSWNTILGSKAAEQMVVGNNNVYIGAWAGRLTTGYTYANTFVGANAGYTGANSGSSTFIGSSAGAYTTTGQFNTFIGAGSGLNNTTGSFNTFTGSFTGLGNMGGSQNTVHGYQAGQFNVIGSDNTFLGYIAGRNSTASNNTFLGSWSGQGTTSGADNTFVGTAAGQNNAVGADNVLLGRAAGLSLTGDQNTVGGSRAGYNSTSGDNNTFYGWHAGYSNGTGNNNTYLGYGAGAAANLTNAAAIGANANVTASNSMALGGTGANAVKVGIGTTAPNAELEVNGYTMLGTTAPKVKMLKLTGTTAATQGGFVSLPHGLNAAKILAVNVLVESAPGANWIAPNFTYAAGTQYEYLVHFLNIVIYNSAANSANILSKPVKVLITYEQ